MVANDEPVFPAAPQPLTFTGPEAQDVKLKRSKKK
jgi:hypothetical protein